MSHSYRAALRAKGIRPLPKTLRTSKRIGDVEIISADRPYVHCRNSGE